MVSIILATTTITHPHDASPRCSTQKCRKLDTMTWRFVLLMALYRGLYILNWVYRCYTKVGYRHHYEVYAAGVVQTALYSRFFWYSYCSSSSYCGSSGSSNSSSSSEQHTEGVVAIQLPILLCGRHLKMLMQQKQPQQQQQLLHSVCMTLLYCSVMMLYGLKSC
jgi:hypothetical protein